ncbi:lytic transglycosylase domain-containing protein [Citrobacter freundii]|jgi:type IV secretion system protein VirB1|uniref:lytic transglycosylase domain-containing protein n=1 Tax=Enterobacterales TaxID=91347 RepID=UPI0005019529|nr:MULTISPECIES: lytic transglycosylase domain-containing protein [Enterobacterales]HEE0120580.1 lytic transglycosylase domain-containing protein [Citrobacter gillenii]AYH00990.1 transglycosylase [Pectobacterium parmentieri]EKN4190198.1 lytic transglycosylase domain-containing protein [Yersinia enterocolitica]EKN4923551.1 transglycosylase [Yersinia enterocolitica]EKN5023353.1 transglycosylase [Yersinia enterocolitica]
MLSPTAFLAATIQCAVTVHPSTAFDVAKVESSFNPYAVAEIVPKEERAPGSLGVISHQPTSKQTAINIIKRVAAKGRRYSVGLMQITSTNFRHYGVTAHDLLDPCINLSIFERILTDCYQRGGTLKRALSCYYSGNFDTGQQPESAFNQTSYIQRIGYAVRSTREDLKRSTTSQSTSYVHYPTTVLRGELTDKTTPVVTSLHYPDAILRGDVSLPVINEEK